MKQDYPLPEDTEETDYDQIRSDHSESASSASMDHNQISHTVERDLVLVLANLFFSYEFYYEFIKCF